MLDQQGLRAAKDMKVLITGGLGFIGQHLARQLVQLGSRVTILDSLLPQIHGSIPSIPADIQDTCHIQLASILDRDAVRAGLDGCDALVHLAAETGTGQSMHAASHHLHVNTVGTALVLEEANHAESVRSIVLASSRAVYGEGAYECEIHGLYSGIPRFRQDLEQGLYDVRCPQCANFGCFVPTPETALLSPQSVYGLSKQNLEQLATMLLAGKNVSASVFRFQNVYGPGQSLINPYTGILAIFSSLARKNEDILIFEDGDETRDFVFVDDAIDAILLALNAQLPGVNIYNVGTGRATKVIEVAHLVARYFGSRSRIMLSRFSRLGDIRHNAADTSRVKAALGHEAHVPFSEGLNKFLDWAQTKDLDALPYRKSLEELEKGGAVIRAL